jgi:hypothetical protein
MSIEIFILIVVKNATFWDNKCVKMSVLLLSSRLKQADIVDYKGLDI